MVRRARARATVAQLTGQYYTRQVIARAGRCTLYWRTWLQSSLFSIQSYTFYSVLPGLCTSSHLLPCLLRGSSLTCRFEQNGWPRQPVSRGAHALMCVSVRLHHVCPRPCHPYDYMSALLSALLGGVTVEMKAAPTARPWAHQPSEQPGCHPRSTTATLWAGSARSPCRRDRQETAEACRGMWRLTGGKG